MTHDLLYQFKREIPLSRRTADVLFLLILKDSGFTWTKIYYFFVRVFGGVLFPGWKTKDTLKNIVIEECSWKERARNELEQLNLPEGLNHPFLK